MKNKELNHLLEKIIDISKQAGKKTLSFYGGDLDIKEKGDNAPVTKADIASNEIIVSELRKTSIPILSEEGVDDADRFDSDLVWIVDPLDGTKDFIQETGEFTIMIGLVEKQKNNSYRPVLGVIYCPVSATVYYATKAGGAWVLCDGHEVRQIKVSPEEKWRNTVMLTSRNHTTTLEWDIAKKLGIPKIITYGSSLKICLIADEKGHINFNPAPYTWEWDICAADIILEEAGGKISDIKGEIFNYNKKEPRNNHGYLATNGIIHDEIVENIKKINSCQS